jgi:uncharacterized protein (DUF427 family)
MNESVWDYPRPPRLEPTARRLRVEHGGETLADAPRGWRVLETSHPPVYYLPREFIRMELLAPSEHRTFCEFKGVASYWDLVLPDSLLSNVGWCYEEPAAGYEDVTGAIAFYASRVDRCRVDDEIVTPQPGGFYGGWITSDITGPFKG